MNVVRLNWCFLLTVAFFFLATRAMAGGFYLTQIASPGSVGTAGVANSVNNWAADSAFTNPAGMTGLENDTVMGGIQVLAPFMRFDSSIATAGGSDGGNAGVPAVVPGGYVVKTLGEDWRMGFSISGPMGGGVDYGDDFVGRYQAFESSIQGIFLSPSVGYRINEQWSVGAGVSAIYTIFNEKLAINNPGPVDGEVKMDGLTDWSAQGFFGLHLNATDNLMFGAVYRTKSDVDLEGDLRITGVQGPPPVNLLSSRLDKIEIEFDLPQTFEVAVKYDVNDRLSLLADANWQDWSAFSDNKVSLEGPFVTTIDRNWKDTWHVGLGMIYDLDEVHRIMVGAGYDSSVVDDEDRTIDLPMDEQLQFSFAFGSKDDENTRLKYGMAATVMYLGDGKVDQAAQGTRFKGEFDTNVMFIVGGMIAYEF